MFFLLGDFTPYSGIYHKRHIFLLSSQGSPPPIQREGRVGKRKGGCCESLWAGTKKRLIEGKTNFRHLKNGP
jgi:hypothetical protein